MTAESNCKPFSVPFATACARKMIKNAHSPLLMESRGLFLVCVE